LQELWWKSNVGRCSERREDTSETLVTAGGGMRIQAGEVGKRDTSETLASGIECQFVKGTINCYC
jgi:hypothetical protein